MSSPFSFSGNFLFSSWSRFVFSVSEPSRPPVNFLLTLLHRTIKKQKKEKEIKSVERLLSQYNHLTRIPEYTFYMDI